VLFDGHRHLGELAPLFGVSGTVELAGQDEPRDRVDGRQTHHGDHGLVEVLLLVHVVVPGLLAWPCLDVQRVDDLSARLILAWLGGAHRDLLELVACLGRERAVAGTFEDLVEPPRVLTFGVLVEAGR
jgi:hypothetical protein